ncbi:MAG: hypothetical protein DRO39_00100 [Thermoprotei archaeon]|mgnify:CR=1 FL=1|nr:MAG: hypothetical protein DRO39_00100 [Thermoprotei archaeon]
MPGIPYLVIAYYLAILSFYIGVLILALPIPFTGVKKWGPRLMSDGILVMVLALTFRVIMSAASYIQHLLGADWGSFMSFQQNLVLLLGYTAAAIMAIATVFNANFLAPIAWKFSAMVTANALLLFVALVIKYNYQIIASLGIALMSIPFRIARGVGATMLAVALVFFIALPLYPSYLSTIFLSSFSTEVGTYMLSGEVKARGGTVEYGYVVLKACGITRYSQIRGGRFVMVVSEQGGCDNYEVLVEAPGHLYYTGIKVRMLSEICEDNSLGSRLGLCKVTIKVPGLVFSSQHIAVHATTDLRIAGVDEGSNSLVITAECVNDEGCTMYIDVPSRTIIRNVTVDGTRVALHKEYGWYWRNIAGATYSVRLARGVHRVAVQFSISEGATILESITRLLPNPFSNSDIVIQAWDSIARLMLMFYALLIGPTSYLAILLGISYGLARAIASSVARWRLW